MRAKRQTKSARKREWESDDEQRKLIKNACKYLIWSMFSMIFHVYIESHTKWKCHSGPNFKKSLRFEYSTLGRLTWQFSTKLLFSGENFCGEWILWNRGLSLFHFVCSRCWYLPWFYGYRLFFLTNNNNIEILEKEYDDRISWMIETMRLSSWRNVKETKIKPFYIPWRCWLYIVCTITWVNIPKAAFTK